MSLLSSPQFLRAVVWFDALTGILLGSLHLLMTSALSEGLGLAPGLLQVSGVLLLGYAALAASIARAQPLPLGRLRVRVLIVGNGAWALASLALWVGAAPAPTLLGQIYLAVHVVSVALLAELQWMGARRQPGLLAA